MPDTSGDDVDFNNQKEKPKRFYWHGVKVSEKVYKHRLKQQANMAKVIKKNRDTPKAPQAKRNLKKSVQRLVEGRRIVNINVLASEMICKKCSEKLHFSDIEGEKPRGLASIFYMRCQKCNSVCTVATDSKHCTDNDKNYFDTNTKAVMGTIDAGLGITHLNKLLAALNIAPIHWKTLKAHEVEVGKCAEKMAYESCKEAILEEKRLIEY